MAYDIKQLEQMIAARSTKNDSLKDQLINSVTSMQDKMAPLRAAGQYAEFFTDRPGMNKVNVSGAFPTQQQDQIVKATMAGQIPSGGIEDVYKSKMAVIAQDQKQKRNFKDTQKFLTDFRKDKQILFAENNIIDLQNLRAVAENKDLKGTKNAVQKLYARFLENRQRLSDTDFKLSNASPLIAEKAKQAWQTAGVDGNFTEENADVIIGVAKAIEENAKRTMGKVADGYVSVSEDMYGIPQFTAYRALNNFTGNRMGENLMENKKTEITPEQQQGAVTQEATSVAVPEATPGQYSKPVTTSTMVKVRENETGDTGEIPEEELALPEVADKYTRI